MITRRQALLSSLAAGMGALATRARGASGEARPSRRGGAHPPVITPNGSSLPWRLNNGVKEYHLTAEPVWREFTPGMRVRCWGYNGSTPGPTIEAVEGDFIRIFVTNKLPENTSIHWHGIILPNGMDGVVGLLQPGIRPGETFVYEFQVKHPGTFMYHPHADETLQIGVGLMGFLIVHPKPGNPNYPVVDRDFCIMLHEWAIHPGAYRPDPNVMLDFNQFTFNSRIFPGTDPLIMRLGDRIRIRFGNLSMDQHPIHMHGHSFKIVGTDGGRIPEAGQWPQTTVPVPVGSTRDIEFIADNPGDWPLHCHKVHHAMNAMAHDFPNLLGVDQRENEKKMRALLPGYMAMGTAGQADMQPMARHMPGPENTIPMMTGVGPFGDIEMGGMFTLMKIRENLESYDKDPGWHQQPKGSSAYLKT